MTELQSGFPVTPTERELFMDALRGFAILGIFIANLYVLSFYDPGNIPADSWHFPKMDMQVLFLQDLLIEGKFYSIFSLLFGWGLALQMQRLKSHSDSLRPKTFIIRRLIFMLFLGLIHLILIWSGDIVAFYALVGFVLLLLIKLSPKKMLVLGVICILLPILLYWLKMQYPLFNKPADYLFSVAQDLDKRWLKASAPEDYFKLIQGGSWKELLIYNFNGLFYRFGDLIFQSRFLKVLGMFLLGYSLGISGYFKFLMTRPKLLLRIAIIGLVIGLPANYMLANLSRSPESYYQLNIEGFYRTIVYAIGVVPLALSYVAILALLFRTRPGNRILMLMTPVGKMAFSNYIFHSLISIVIFYGVGLGYMGMLGPLSWTIFAVVVFTLQIIFSTIWLTYFQFGPIEWVWRSLTYGKMQPFIVRK